MKEVGKIIEQSYVPKKDKSRRYIAATIIAFFVGTAITMLLYPLTFITGFDLTKIILGFALLGFLVPVKFYSKAFDFVNYEVVILNLLGIGPFFTALFLTINFLITTETSVNTYEFNSFVKNANDIELLIIENTPQLPQKAFICSPSILHEMRGNFLEITIEKGLFGVEVIKDRKIVSAS